MANHTSVGYPLMPVRRIAEENMNGTDAILTGTYEPPSCDFNRVVMVSPIVHIIRSLRTSLLIKATLVEFHRRE